MLTRSASKLVATPILLVILVLWITKGRGLANTPESSFEEWMTLAVLVIVDIVLLAGVLFGELPGRHGTYPSGPTRMALYQSADPQWLRLFDMYRIVVVAVMLGMLFYFREVTKIAQWVYAYPPVGESDLSSFGYIGRAVLLLTSPLSLLLTVDWILWKPLKDAWQINHPDGATLLEHDKWNQQMAEKGYPGEEQNVI
jgi:hypothetical protein